MSAIASIQAVFPRLAAGFEDPAVRIRYIAGVGLVLFLFPFGIAFIVGGLLPARFAWTASVIIILNGLVTFVSELRSGSPRTSIIRFVGLFATLFAVEWIGVRTGTPFGKYVYTDILRFSLLGVPIAIPFAWYATVINTWRMSEPFDDGGSASGLIRTAFAAGLLTLALDLVLEPMATRVNGYWLWQSGRIPLENYVSWFLLSASAVGLLAFTDRTLPGPTPDAAAGRRRNGILLFSLQWALFALTDIVSFHYLDVCLSAAILLVVWIARDRVRRKAPLKGNRPAPEEET